MTIPYGVANVVVSLMSGAIVQYTGRIPVVALAFLVDLGIQVGYIFQIFKTLYPHPLIIFELSLCRFCR